MKNLPSFIKFLIKTYLLCMVYFTVLRLILMMLNYSALQNVPFYYTIKAHQFGLGFDTLIICYIILLPFALQFLFSFTRKSFPWLNKFSLFFISALFILSLLISCSDMPWFQHQQTRITTAALQWTNSPAM